MCPPYATNWLGDSLGRDTRTSLQAQDWDRPLRRADGLDGRGYPARLTSGQAARSAQCDRASIYQPSTGTAGTYPEMGRSPVHATVIVLPSLGSGRHAHEMLRAEGDRVEKGEALYVLDTDKVTQEVEADATGYLTKILGPLRERSSGRLSNCRHRSRARCVSRHAVGRPRVGPLPAQYGASLIWPD